MILSQHNEARWQANSPVCMRCSKEAGKFGICPSDFKPIHLHADCGWCPLGKLPAPGDKPQGWDELPDGREAPQSTASPRPSLLANVLHGAVGVAKALTGLGGADDELVRTRSAICMDCPHATISLGILQRCEKCGCATAAKVRNADEHCPIGKW